MCGIVGFIGSRPAKPILLEGLQILVQANNITNEPYVAYSEDKQRLIDYQEYGTQYLLGLNYRF